jgi:hypothetical protein
MSTIQDIIQERGISEVLHFTTNNGIVGIFAAGALLSRDDLNEEDHLGNVRLLNCAIRRDSEWTRYVNLSISAVNSDLLGISSNNWHQTREGLWWAVLSFSPDVLLDDGVVFTTTNNVYHSTVRRDTGPAGLEALFAQDVPWGYYGSVKRRSSSTPANQPTDLQAEVLYPGGLDLSRLQAIYVPHEDHIDDIEGFIAAIPNAPSVPVQVKPEVFL